MSSVEFELQIGKLVAELEPVVVEGVSHGLNFADRAMQNADRQTFPFYHPLSLRVGFRLFFDSFALPEGWELGGDPARMGQTLLVSSDYQIRFLKERRRTYPGGAPPAGRNHARQAFYYQPPLLDLNDVKDRLDIHERERLLLLWDYGDPEQGAEIELRLVRPIGPGIYGEKVPTDLSVPLNGLSTEFRFVGANEEDLDLFSVEISKEENGDDAEQSG